MVFAAYYVTVLCQFRHNVAGTYAHAETLMALAHEHGFALRYEQGRILLGWALAMQDDTVAGMAQIRQGLEARQNVGSRLWHPYCLSLLAEACGQAGQPEAGLLALAEALTLMAETDEHDAMYSTSNPVAQSASRWTVTVPAVVVDCNSASGRSRLKDGHIALNLDMTHATRATCAPDASCRNIAHGAATLCQCAEKSRASRLTIGPRSNSGRVVVAIHSCQATGASSPIRVHRAP